jgi:ribosomal protein L11 methyltransferase
MEWLEASITVDNEAAEAAAEVLSRYAHRGVVIEASPDGGSAGTVTVRAYLPADERAQANRHHIEEALWHLGQIWPIPAPIFHSIAEDDWTEAWKKQLRVLHVGQHIVIRPSWLDYTPMPDDIVIQLDPGMAFGTGLHPTTQLCLEALEMLVQPGMDVLDVGTGSGILAIAAARLGARDVIAVDSDPTAVKTARENVVVNGAQEIVSVLDGSLDEIVGDYDAIAINILAQVIVETVQHGLSARVRPGGKIIAAGILIDQESDVAAAMDQQGLTLIERRQRDDWVCLVGERPYSSCC